MYLMPSCSNPTAIEMPLERRKKIAEIISRHHLLVLEDDSYRFLSDISCPTFYELLPEQTLYINSTTKVLSSGIRIAYLLFPDRLQNRILNAERATNLHYSSLDAEIISELIHSGDYLKMQQSNKTLAEKRNALYSSIFGIQASHINPYSLHRWLPLGCSNQSLIEQLHTGQISVMESQLFNAGTCNADYYIRIALSSENDIHTLGNALRAIALSCQSLLHSM